MNRQVSRERVFVGLSGGVDSSVSAALLKQAGYDVTGVFIKIWSPEWTECTSKQDRLDAMRVCAHLRIPFKEIDLTEEYKRDVVEVMIQEYRVGRTPNPDVMCNRSIKFGAFLAWAEAHGADFIATGHYAQRELQNGLWTLTCSLDEHKDQTYFLWTLSQSILKKTLFPVGGFTKGQVRMLAKKFGLPTQRKKDSQGLCFIGHVDIKDFLSRYIPPRRGNVLNHEGTIIGFHEGAEFLTVGERHGFTITSKTRADKPLYVVSRDVATNSIVVSPRKADDSRFSTSVVLSAINWVGHTPVDTKTFEAQVRYHGTRYPCHVKGSTVIFKVSPNSLALGQSLVVYDGEKCLGGGVMDLYGV